MSQWLSCFSAIQQSDPSRSDEIVARPSAASSNIVLFTMLIFVKSLTGKTIHSDVEASDRISNETSSWSKTGCKFNERWTEAVLPLYRKIEGSPQLSGSSSRMYLTPVSEQQQSHLFKQNLKWNRVWDCTLQESEQRLSLDSVTVWTWSESEHNLHLNGICHGQCLSLNTIRIWTPYESDCEHGDQVALDRLW